MTDSRRLISFFSALALPLSAWALSDGFDQSLAAIRATGPEGQGNPAAAQAWQKLSQADAGAILPILSAMDGAGPLAGNWLRSAVEVIVERELAAGRPLPMGELKAFLLDTRQSPRARRLAFDLLAKVDPETAGKLVPGMLNDPATEMRRDAVQQLMDEGAGLIEAGKTDAANLIYRQALHAARDVDQIQTIARQLTGKLKQSIDLPEHFGFLLWWKVIAPFDNTGREGFDTVFPPEKSIDLEAAYPGKSGEVRWQDFASTDDYGKVDFNQPFGPLKEVTGYAFTTFDAAEARPAEIRLGCKDAWKIWFNGKLLFGRDEYHRGQRIDQYKLPVQLKKGENTILIKLCQNEQTQDWTVEWEFQMRICDAAGAAILAENRPPAPKKEAPRQRRGGADAN